MLTGKGGYIGVFKNEKGLFIIDDQFANISGKIFDKLKTISDIPISIFVNTHFHGDQTRGNSNFSEKGATIHAQNNVRQRIIENRRGDCKRRFSNPKT